MVEPPASMLISDTYKQSIYDKLNNKGRDEFITELNLIKEELNNGKTLNCKR